MTRSFELVLVMGCYCQEGFWVEAVGEWDETRGDVMR